MDKAVVHRRCRREGWLSTTSHTAACRPQVPDADSLPYSDPGHTEGNLADQSQGVVTGEVRGGAKKDRVRNGCAASPLAAANAISQGHHLAHDLRHPKHAQNTATELGQVARLAAADDAECSRGGVSRGGTETVPQEKWPRG